MPVSADALRTHIDYSAWASRRLTDAAATLSLEEITKDFKTADRSVLDTLAHIFAGDRVWLARVSGGPIPSFITDADRNLAVLQNDWPAVLGRWAEWAGSLTDESVSEGITYHDLKGRQWTTPIWQIVMHVVNHATHHRGQVAGFLRSMGHTPPPLDLIAYYREIGKAASA